MAKLRRLSGNDVIKVLEQMGFERVRQRGSHVIMKKQILGETQGCVVPLHGEVAIGTLKGILRQTKISLEEFMKYS